MNLKKLTDRAKDLVEKRGGTESLKQDAEELKGIAKGQGSLTDKAKQAVSAIKDPGETEARQPAPAAEGVPVERERADEKVTGERGGRDSDPAV